MCFLTTVCCQQTVSFLGCVLLNFHHFANFCQFLVIYVLFVYINLLASNELLIILNLGLLQGSRLGWVHVLVRVFMYVDLCLVSV